jgi:hypothetical protein
MEDFKLLMDKTMAVLSTPVSLWGYSFTFIDVVGYTFILVCIIQLVRVLLWIEDG